MKRKTLKIIGLLCIVCIAVAALVTYRLYNKPHRSAAKEDAIAVSATQLAEEFQNNEPASNKKYLGKALQVSGTVSEVSADQQGKPVVLLAGSAMSGVQCTLTDAGRNVAKGRLVTVKGFCSGVLSDVIMDRCVIVQ